MDWRQCPGEEDGLDNERPVTGRCTLPFPPPPIRLCDKLNERGTFLNTQMARIIAFVCELLHNVVPVVLEPVPPQLADKETVQAFRLLSEWYRGTARDTNSLFLDVERKLWRAFDVQEQMKRASAALQCRPTGLRGCRRETTHSVPARTATPGTGL